MTCKNYKHFLWIQFVLIFSLLETWGVSNSFIQAQSVTVGRATVSVYNEVCYGIWRDFGVTQRLYENVGASQGIDVQVNVDKWTITGDFAASGGVASHTILPIRNFSTAGWFGSSEVNIGTICRVWRNLTDEWEIGVGGSLSNFVMVSNFSKFGNASFALSDLFQPELTAMARYTLPNRESMAVLPSWLTVYGLLRVAPIGLAYRPGFATIDNFTASAKASECLFSSYETAASYIPLVGCELGLKFNLRSGNRIGMAYRWTARSTRGASTSPQLDFVLHSLKVDFDMVIKR